MLVYFSFFYLLIPSEYLMLIVAIIGAILGYTGYLIGYKYIGVGLIGAFFNKIYLFYINYAFNYAFFKSISIQCFFSIQYGILISPIDYFLDYRDMVFNTKIGLRTSTVRLDRYLRLFLYIFFLLFYPFIIILIILKVYMAISLAVFIMNPSNTYFVKNPKKQY